MAKTWSISEAVKAIQDMDKEAIQDIGKRFPLFATAAAAGNANAIFEAIPERVSVRVIESAMRDGAPEAGGADDGDEGDEAAPAKEEKKAAIPAAAAADGDYEGKGAYALYCMCKERGIAVKSKQPKETYIAALQAADGAKPAAKASKPAKPAKAAEDEDPAEDADEYSSKSAKELFTMCKERKIKVEPKKPAEFYAKKLRDDDAAAEDGAEEDAAEDNGWGEEEAKPAAKPAKAAAKAAKPAKAKEDEDWDI